VLQKLKCASKSFVFSVRDCVCFFGFYLASDSAADCQPIGIGYRESSQSTVQNLLCSVNFTHTHTHTHTHACVSVTKQYNLLLTKVQRRSATGKLTASLSESNRSHMPVICCLYTGPNARIISRMKEIAQMEPDLNF